MTCDCEKKERHDWFPLAVGDFLASDTVAECEPWEIQAYLHMMVLSWQGPGVTADRERLARRLGLDLERVTRLMDGPVGQKWTECCGRLWNDRLEKDREEATQRLQAKRDAGRKGGKASAKARAEAKQEASTAQAVLDECSSSAQAPVEQCLDSAQANPTTLHDTTLHHSSQHAGAREGGGGDRVSFKSPAAVPEGWLAEQVQEAEALLSDLPQLGKVSAPVKARLFKLAAVQLSGEPPGGWGEPPNRQRELELQYRNVAGDISAWVRTLVERKKPGGRWNAYMRAIAEHGPEPDSWLPPGTPEKPERQAREAS